MISYANCFHPAFHMTQLLLLNRLKIHISYFMTNWTDTFSAKTLQLFRQICYHYESYPSLFYSTWIWVKRSWIQVSVATLTRHNLWYYELLAIWFVWISLFTFMFWIGLFKGLIWKNLRVCLSLIPVFTCFRGCTGQARAWMDWNPHGISFRLK